MKIPFSTEAFFGVFETYNSSVFPLQFLIMAFGIITVILLHSGSRYKNTAISYFLAFVWLWTGILYHLLHFTAINMAAYSFGILFILQGLFFILELSRKRLNFFFPGGFAGYTGYFFVWFGLLIYPLISYFAKGSWAGTIALGLPCPTTIFTFGLLMLTSRAMPRYLLIIPSIWTIIGTGAAVNFGVYQDYMMLLSAVVANIYLLKRKRITK
ncbi:DUF6064 family protein [Marinilabilia rubra]|uniref:Uncharacterized protein n=1 Tax=Marinilabilia rubra TaxID=2162893 RepID=A0A2U2B9A5_9BACT|nr:DUF6064 family protein [Marinilabilia rubra]PWD99637.1 hypothetical protein DDZ16_09325 [Marinilabilia rubra]